MNDNNEKTLGAIYLCCASPAPDSVAELAVTRNQLAERAAWEEVQIVKVYEDRGVSGLRKPEQRPGLAALLEDARKGTFAVLYIRDFSRLGRRMEHTLDVENQLRQAGMAIRVGGQDDEMQINEELMQRAQNNLGNIAK